MSKPVFKIILVGDQRSGKSSLIRQYVHHTFNNTYAPTVGVDFSYTVTGDTELLLWDISGGELHNNITTLYYRNALVACVVFDVTNISNLNSVIKWKEDIDRKVTLPNGDRLPVILLANKCDLDDSIESLDAFCHTNMFAGWFKTSANDYDSIERAMSYIIHEYKPISEYKKVREEYTDRECSCILL